MSNFADIAKTEKNNEDRVFELECEVSLLRDLIAQLTGELKDQGLKVSDRLID